MPGHMAVTRVIRGEKSFRLFALNLIYNYSGGGVSGMGRIGESDARSEVNELRDEPTAVLIRSLVDKSEDWAVYDEKEMFEDYLSRVKEDPSTEDDTYEDQVKAVVERAMRHGHWLGWTSTLQVVVVRNCSNVRGVYGINVESKPKGMVERNVWPNLWTGETFAAHTIRRAWKTRRAAFMRGKYKPGGKVARAAQQRFEQTATAQRKMTGGNT